MFGLSFYRANGHNGNGISMTVSSGVPYRHGQPRQPVHPHPYSPPGSTVSSYMSQDQQINYQFSNQGNHSVSLFTTY